jgi:ketoreductase RED1
VKAADVASATSGSGRSWAAGGARTWANSCSRAGPGQAWFANRLQSAIFQKCVHLVRSGVVDVAELDAVVTNSLGVRWASDGPFLGLHLGGGPGGLRHLLEHLGPGMARRRADLGRPDPDPEAVEAIGDATEHAYGDRGYPELAEGRDRREIAVLSALAAEGARP